MSLSDAAEAANSRILTKLEDGGRGDSTSAIVRGRRATLRNIIFGLVAILGAGASIFAYQAVISPHRATPGVSHQPVTATAAKLAPAPIPVMAAATLPAAEARPDEVAATIVNEPAQVASNPSNETSRGDAFQSLKPVLPENEQGKTSPAPESNRKPERLALANPQKTALAPRKSDVRASTAGSKHSVPPSRATSRTAPTQSKPSDAARKPQAADSDASLLAAILAHNAGRQPTNPQKNAKIALQASTADNAKTSGRNRDIVERKPGDSSEGLLQRCRQLGFLEGELCRWRICADRWSTDAACKS